MDAQDRRGGIPVQFQFFMVGGGQAPMVEVAAGDLSELIEIDGCDPSRPILIPVHRIQLVTTA